MVVLREIGIGSFLGSNISLKSAFKNVDYFQTLSGETWNLRVENNMLFTKI